MHQILKPDETIVASVEVRAVRVEGRPSGRIFKDPVLGDHFFFCIIVNSLGIQSKDVLSIVAGYTKLSHHLCRTSDGSSCGSSRATATEMAQMQGLALTDS